MHGCIALLFFEVLLANSKDLPSRCFDNKLKIQGMQESFCEMHITWMWQFSEDG